MYVIAVIGDLLSLIPFVNIFSGIGTSLALFLAEGEGKVRFYSPEQIGITLAVMGGELIPGVSAMPLWTIRVFLAKRLAASRE